MLGVGLVLISSIWVLNFPISELNIPWIIQGDMVHVYTFAQNIKDHSSPIIFPNLGWPYISDLTNWGIPSIFDYSYFLITTQFLTAIESVNLLIFIGFIFVQIFTYLMFQKLGFSYISSLVLSLSLTLSPWHFQRSLWHVSLANYFTIPLIIISLIYLYELQNKYKQTKFISIILILLLISTTHPYYWIFSEFLLISFLIFLIFLNRKNLNLTNIMCIFVLPISVIFQKLIINRENLYVVLQSPVERGYEFIERYSGSFIALFMPNPFSGFNFLASTRGNFDAVSKLSIGESGPWNSILGIIFIGFTITLFVALIIKPNLLSNNNDSKEDLIRLFLFLFVLTLLFYWTTGFGALFSFFVSDWIRSWGRLFIYLLYFATIVFALVLKKCGFISKLKREQKIVLFSIVTLIFIFDQSLKQIPNDFINSKKTYFEINQFNIELSKKIANDCPVLQLPVLRYPEGGAINGLSDYDHFWLYLTNPERNYSYGAVKGTQQANWQEKIDKKSITKILNQASAIGYCAIILDLRAYENLVETGNLWIKAAGKPLAVSSNTRLAAFKVDSQKTNSAAIQSLVTLTWKGKADSGTIQGSKQIDFYQKDFDLYALNPTQAKVIGKIKFGVRSGNCSPNQTLTIYDSNNNIIQTEKLSNVTKQFEIKLNLDSRKQTNFKFKLSSTKCNVEWFSDALVSIRNERFLLN